MTLVKLLTVRRHAPPSVSGFSARSKLLEYEPLLGGAATDTVTLTVRLAWPPGPAHVSVKALGLVDNAALFSLPAVGRVPDHAPLAAHEVALVEDQVSAVVRPAATDVGEADSVTTGALGGGLVRSEEHTSELQSRLDLVCRLLLEK